MDEVVTAPAAPQKHTLTKEERSKIATDAAKRRWAKQKKTAKKSIKAKSPAKTKKKSGPREFSSALKVAEKRLAKAITERAEAAARYAVLSAEIPSLQRVIQALKNPIDFSVAAYAPAPTLEQIVGGEPLQYANPPRSAVPSPTAAYTPPMRDPVATSSRAMGGAIGVELPEPEDEDMHLRESGVAGGEWH